MKNTALRLPSRTLAIVSCLVAGCGSSTQDTQTSDLDAVPPAPGTSPTARPAVLANAGVGGPASSASAGRSALSTNGRSPVPGTAVAGGAPTPGAGTGAQPAGAGAGASGATGATNTTTTMPAEQPVDAALAQRYPDAPPEVLRYAQDWPLPNHHFDNTRNAPTRIDSSNVAQLRESWRFALDGGFVFGSITASPIVMGERIYLQDMQSNVYALMRADGKALWRHNFGQPTLGPNGVAVGWGKVFAASSETELVALDMETGDLAWTYKPTLTSSEGVAIQPVAYGGMVYASTMPATMTRGAYSGGAIGRLLALDAQTGKLNWSFDTVDSKDIWGDAATNCGGGAWFSPLIAPDYGLSYWGTGNPGPFPGSTGKPLGASRPGPNLYTSSIVAVGLMDGKLSWYYQDKPHDIFDLDFQQTPLMVRASAQSGTDVIIGAGKTGTVAAVNARDGKRVWRVPVGAHENDDLQDYPAGQSYQVFPGLYGGVISALAYADDAVYVASLDSPYTFDGQSLSPSFNAAKGHLTAIQVSTGTVLWNAELKGASYGAATIANDLVFTSDEHGHVYGFKRASGDKVWDYQAPAGINAPLVVTGDEILIPAGVGDGASLVRLGLPNATLPTTATMPVAGQGSAGAAGAAAPTQPADLTFTGVYNDILKGRGCAAATGCHANSTAGGLDLSSRDIAYRSLVNAAAQGMGSPVACSSTGLKRVVPSDPAKSLLVNKLETAMPMCGAQMPPGALLPAALVDRVRGWIQKGAKDD